MKFSHMYTTILALMAMGLGAAAVSVEADGPVQGIIKDLKKAPDGIGFRHLGPDGVLRSLDADLNVVDYARLTPAQITELVSLLPESARADLSNLASVDGRVVSPAAAQTPSPEIHEIIQKAYEKSKAALSAKAAVSANPAANAIKERSCGTEVCSSDYDCYPHGCLGCIIVTNGLGFCYGF